MHIHLNKRKLLHKERVQLPQDLLETPKWPSFHCFGTPIWPPLNNRHRVWNSASSHKFPAVIVLLLKDSPTVIFFFWVFLAKAALIKPVTTNAVTCHHVSTAAPVMECVTSQREDTGAHAHKVLADTSVKSDCLGRVKMSWCWRMPQALESTISGMKTTSPSQCTATLVPNLEQPGPWFSLAPCGTSWTTSKEDPFMHIICQWILIHLDGRATVCHYPVCSR